MTERLKKQELEKAMFRQARPTNSIKKQGRGVARQIKQVEGEDFTVKYNKHGSVISNAAKVGICASHVQKNGVSTYSVLFNSRGILFDPNGLYDEHEIQTTSRNRKGFELRKVNKLVFTDYLKFLQTGNRSHMNNAMRKLVQE